MDSGGLAWPGQIILNNMMEPDQPPSLSPLSKLFFPTLGDKIYGYTSHQFFFTITVLVGSDMTWEQSAEPGKY